MASRIPFVLGLVILLWLGGCAAGRSVVTAHIDPGVNPSHGRSVRIASVDDGRVFAADPPSANMPSLMHVGEIQDKGITSRAIARKRGGFGLALGDVLLPEGVTVQKLTRSAVTSALRQAGYRVLERSDAGYENAAPIAVRIDEFWSWFSPGFASVAVTFRGKVRLQGAIDAIQRGQDYSAEVRDEMMAVLESDWAAIVNKGLEALRAAITRGLGRQGVSQDNEPRVVPGGHRADALAPAY